MPYPIRVLFLCLFFAACVPQKRGDLSTTNSVSVMAFNVENLFDTLDNPNKRDETYIPLSQKTPQMLAKCLKLPKAHWRKSCQEVDWNKKVLDRKMRRVADVIKQVKSGQGPEILILPEVENKKVIESLRRKYLSGLGYKESLLIEGPDPRGMNVAILTKLEVVSSQNHRIVFELRDGLTSRNQRPTRDILQADLRLPDGQLLTVLGVHFPAPQSPTGTRIQSIRYLNQIKRTLPKDRLVIAGGDFNITSQEEKTRRLYGEQLGAEWAVSHEMGCKTCKGTYYYPPKVSWSFLDNLLFSKQMLPEVQGPWQVLVQSIRVPTKSLYQTNRKGFPARYGKGQTKTGVSDHWPIAAEIVLHRQPEKRGNK